MMGVSPSPMTEQEKEQILDWIRSEHAAGRALNLHAVKRRRPDLVARVYEVRPFWGWWQAIQDAGLDYADLKVELAENVACRICGYEGKQLNAHLRFRHQVTAAEYREKFPGAEIAGEARRANMKKDGGNHLLPHWEPLYSDEYMMDRTFRYHRMGHHLRTTWILENDHNLWQHVHRQGISWDSYVASLGIVSPEAAGKPRKPRASKLTKEAVIEGLREAAQRKRWTRQGTQYGKLSAKLRKGVRRHFGDYETALEAAGIPLPAPTEPPKPPKTPKPRPPKPPKQPKLSPDEVLERLRQLAASGVRITDAGIRKHPEHSGLHAYVTRMGGYPAVREQLGLAKPPAADRMPRYTREEVVAAMRLRVEEGKPCKQSSLMEGADADRVLLRSAKEQFPRWTDLLNAVGVENEHPAKIRARQRKEALIRTLQLRHETGETLDARSLRGEEGGKELLRQCSQVFGGWGEALEAAGLPKELGDLRAQDRERLVGRIREIHRQGGGLDSSRAKADPATAELYREAKLAFPSWRAAVIAAGLEWPQPRAPKPKPGVRVKKAAAERPKRERGPAPPASPGKREERKAEHDARKAAVIEAIQERHRAKMPLEGREIRREPEVVALYDEARRLFTSWKAALRAAGCTPEPLPPIKLPRSKIVEELEAAYPIDPRWLLPKTVSDEEDEDEDGDFEGTLPKVPVPGSLPPKTNKKQRHTPSRAELRKKRKKGRR